MQVNVSKRFFHLEIILLQNPLLQGRLKKSSRKNVDLLFEKCMRQDFRHRFYSRTHVREKQPGRHKNEFGPTLG
jgi:hypothetical protein